jgi:hypothetical protein
MAEILSVVIIFWLFYYLFIKGVAYPILLFAFGVWGGRALILANFEGSGKTILTFMSHDMSYATFIAAVISILGIAYLTEVS